MFYRQDDEHVIVSSRFHLAKIDLNTGSVLWSSPYPEFPCTGNCSWNGSVFLQNGDQLFMGENDSKARVRRMHNDGSGTYDLWTLEPNDPAVRSLSTEVATTPSGKVMIRLARYHRLTPGGFSVLAGFDPDSGTVTSEQVIRSVLLTRLAGLGATCSAACREPDAVQSARRHETQPLSNDRFAGYNDHGAWGLTLSSKRIKSPSMVGDNIGFACRELFGDQPLSGVAVQVAPDAGHPQRIELQYASRQQLHLDDRSGNATHDSTSTGGSFEITGRMLSLRNAETHYSVESVGSVGLSEPIRSKISPAHLFETLFADGFDDHRNP